MKGTEQWGFVVEGFACVRDEDGGDAERVVDDEDRRGGVPGGIAAGLEGAADAARRKRGGVWLLLDKEFAGELFHHASLAIVLDEGVVLLGGAFRQGLKPVGIVGHSVVDGPLLHAGSDTVGNGEVETGAVVHHVHHRLVNFFREIFVHLLSVEDLASEILRGSLTGRFYVERLLLEGFADNLKS